MKKENKNALIISLLLIVIIGLFGYIIYDKFSEKEVDVPVVDNGNNNEDSNNESDVTVDENEDFIIYEYTSHDDKIVSSYKLSDFTDEEKYELKIYNMTKLYSNTEYYIEKFHESILRDNQFGTISGMEVAFDSGVLAEDNLGNFGLVDYKKEKILIPFEYKDIYCFNPSEYYEDSPISYCAAKKGTKHDLYQFNSDTNTVKKMDLRVDELYKMWQNDYMYVSIDSDLVALDVKTLKELGRVVTFEDDYDNYCSSLEKEWIAFEKGDSFVQYEYNGDSSFMAFKEIGKRCN